LQSLRPDALDAGPFERLHRWHGFVFQEYWRRLGDPGGGVDRHNPTISVTAPALSGPSASTSGAVTQIAYTSGGGASQVYTSGIYNYVMNRLLDTMTIDAKATNAVGFTTGSYTISTTATCSQ
jgi:hypothetical protein